MDNLEQLYCHSVPVKQFSGVGQVGYSYTDGVSCIITSDHLMIFENDSDVCTVHHITGIKGFLRYVKYLPIFDVIFLATDKELVIFRHRTQKTQICYVTKNTITELSWNPTETILIIIESDEQIYSYTFSQVSFNLQYTSRLTADVPVPVLVGWGSQNTQFKGPKQKKSNGIEDKCEVKQILKVGAPRISWRGNGELFAVNYSIEGKRFIKVFDTDLNPLNQSEEYFNLCEPVAFMGQGQCIACCAVRNDINHLVIFEKNCKVKAVFDVPEVKGDIKKLVYHPQMNILAVQSLDEDGQSYINIFLYSNAKWLMKQQLFYPASCKVFGFEWLNLQENLFTTCKLVVFTAKNIEHHNFRFTINRCPLSAMVAVINGRTIEYYAFDERINPPPMNLRSFQHDRPINRISFHPKRRICAILDAVFQVRLLEIAKDDIVTLAITEQPHLTGSLSFVSLNWNADGHLHLNLECNNDNQDNVKEYGDISVQITKVERDFSKFSLQYDDTEESVTDKLTSKDSKIIYLTKRFVNVDNAQVELDFALTSNRELYVNESMVCSGVTSVFIFRQYLIMTHANCKLYCTRLKDYSTFASTMELSKLFSREIEQGARIVSCNNVLPPQIILQLPRGNLESIGYKLITIDVIEDMLRENKWNEVLRILREEKVNWNVLIDLNPTRFTEHIEEFIRAARNLAVLNAIVTEFCLLENCFETFYINYLPNTFPSLTCDKLMIVQDILNCLISTDCINNLSSIVAIQQKHLSLKSALKSIKDVFEADTERNESVCSKALNQILIQEHFKDVLDAAYSFFSLDFLSLVYHNSTEDPKIYEPEIANLKQLEPIMQRFHMCVKGHNLKNAVRYLLRCDDFSEDYISDFIVKNKLEDAAYASIGKQNDHFELVTRLYAKRLGLQKKHIEAGLILKRAKLFNEALVHYKYALEWREVLGLMTLMEYPEEDRKDILFALSNNLLHENRIDEAAMLLELYIKDYNQAIMTLAEHKCFRKAICVAQTYGDFDIVESEILPRLKYYLSVLMEKINGFKNNFETYADRLKVVRQEKKLKLSQASEGIYEGDEDLYSEAGSTISSLGSSRATSRSRGSTASSKNRRKEERKKTDLRKGGFYEDIALMRALHILYTETLTFGKDIREVCLIAEHNDLDMTKQLHQKFLQLQKDMIKRIPEIWPEIFIKDVDSSDYDVLAIIQNKQDLDPKYRAPPPDYEASLSWRLDIFS